MNSDQKVLFPQNDESKEELSFSQLQKQIADLIYQVVKPEEHLSNQIAAESLKNKKKKKMDR